MDEVMKEIIEEIMQETMEDTMKRGCIGVRQTGVVQLNFVQDETNNSQTQTFYFSKKIEDTRQRYQFCFVQTIHQLSQTFSQVFYKHYDDLVFRHSK